MRTVPTLRAVRRDLSKALRTSEPPTVLAAAEEIARAGYRWVGYELIARHSVTARSLNLRQVETLGKGVDAWGVVDAFGIYIAGPAWLHGQISDAAIQRWARRRDVWWRRAALVATTVLNARSHGGGGDAQRTLDVARLLVRDREDMVVKALSWALRSLVPWDPDAVSEFLQAHDAELAARVKREVNNKLRTGRKSGRRT